MSRYTANIITKSPATPTGPTTAGRAPGIWRMDEVAYWTRQGLWPNANIQAPDTYFPYVSMLLSTTSLGNANNNLFVDSSGAFNPVSRNGNTTQGSFTPYSTNWSNYFDGNGDYLTVADNAAIQFGTGNFTVEGWFNLASFTTAPIFDQRASGPSTNAFIIAVTSAGKMIYYSYSPLRDVTFNTTLSINTWYHFAFVRSGNTGTMYVNGVAEATTVDMSGYNNTSSANRIMQAFDPSYATGYLSNFRIVKGTAVYTANFTPPTAPLTAISGTGLLTCQSNRFRDASGNNLAITVYGDSRVTDFGPFSPAYPGASYNQSDITNWSGYFDGSGDYLSTPTLATIGSGSFSQEAWVYPTVAASGQALLWDAGVGAGTFLLIDGTTNILGGTNGNVALTAPFTLPVGVWTHLAYCRSGTTLSIYANGTRIATGTVSTSLGSGNYFIGAARDATRFFTGYISNLRFITGSSAYDATQSTITVPTSQLTAVANTSLLTLQNAAFTDNSTNNFVITPYGNATVTGNSPFNTVGYWSNYFNGTNSRMSIADNAAFGFGTGNFTVEFWLNYTGGNGYKFFFVNNSGSGNYVGYGLQVGTLTPWVWNNGDVLVASSNITPNTWQHHAVVRNGSTLTIYLNGTAIGSTTWTVDLGTSRPLWIGWNGGNDSQTTQGNISNFRVVKGTAVYTSNFTPPTAPLTAISGTSALTCQNGRFIDNSTNNFAVTVSGTVLTQPYNPFYTATIASNGGSMYFDGSGDYLQVPTNASLQFGTSDFTVEFWMNLIARDSSGTAVFNNYNSFTTGALGFFAGHASASSTVYQVAVNGTFPAISSTQTIVYNSWNHFAIVRNGNTLTLYINGVANGTFSMSGITINGVGSNWWLGSAQDAPSNYELNGYLANFRVSKFAVYTAAFTPPTAPLTPSANTTLLINGMNAGVYDATTINDMETVGNAQVSTAVSKFGTGSIGGFNGSTSQVISYAGQTVGNFGSGDFTVELWVNTTAAAGPGLLTQSSAAGATNTSWGLFLGYASANSADIYLSNGSSYFANTGGGNINDGNWHHVAFSRSGSSGKLFVDGVQVGSTLSLGTTALGNGTKQINIGGQGSSFLLSQGYIENVRITKGYARYTTNFTPPTQAFPVY